MKLLLDTCTFLWLTTDETHLSNEALALYQHPGNEVYLSTTSAWEIAIKHKSGKLRLPFDMSPAQFIPEARLRHGIETLPASEEDCFILDKLPPIHYDPFDRMLICQAIANQMTLLTPDPLITRYPVLVRW